MERDKFSNSVLISTADGFNMRITKGSDTSAFTIAVTGTANKYGFPKFFSIKKVPAPITIGEIAIPREPNISPIFVVKHKPRKTD